MAARLLSIASAIVGVAATSGYTSAGANTACRVNSTSSCSDPCSNYDHVTRIDDIAMCEMLCDSRANCTGIEYNPSMKRCEIWKVDFAHNITANGFECRSYTGATKTQDTDLWASVVLAYSNVDMTGYFGANPAAVAPILAGFPTLVAGILANLTDQTGMQMSGITAAHMVVALDSQGCMQVILPPSADVNPLAFYAVFRGSNGDLIPDVLPLLQAGVAPMLLALPNISGFMTGTPAVTVVSRNLTSTGPTTETRTTTTAGATTTTTTTSNNTGSSSGSTPMPQIADGACSTALFVPVMVALGAFLFGA